MSTALSEPSQDVLYNVHDDISEVLFSEEQIRDRVKELGRQISEDYGDKAPMIMPILKGGFIVAADLVRALNPVPDNMTIEFVSASSYGKGTETSGTVTVSFNKDVVLGRNVLLVDDLADSGLTLVTVTQEVLAAGAASVKSLVLLDKRERRKVECTPDYIGFQCPNVWISGLGMDTAQIYRSLPYIGIIRPDAAKKAVAKGYH